MSLNVEGIRDLLEQRGNPGGTHYADCFLDHVDCALSRLLEEHDRLRVVLEHIASKRCLCEGHLPQYKPHGGPCCTQTCVTCVARQHVEK